MSKFLEFIRTPKGLIITAIVVLVLVIIISYNWTTIKGWFSKNPISAVKEIAKCPPGWTPYRDDKGKIQCEKPTIIYQ